MRSWEIRKTTQKGAKKMAGRRDRRANTCTWQFLCSRSITGKMRLLSLQVDFSTSAAFIGAFLWFGGIKYSDFKEAGKIRNSITLYLYLEKMDD